MDQKTAAAKVARLAEGDTIEVAGDNDANAFRLRVGEVRPTQFGDIAGGFQVDLRGRPIRPRDFPLYAGVPYVVVPARRWGLLRERLFGRAGRHRGR